MKGMTGSELAKVLWYYNLIYETATPLQHILCPFHEDVNPSMVVDLQKNSWYCFGCSRGGDALKFVIEMERKYNDLNELQAVKKYREILRSKKVSDIHIRKHMKEVKSNRSLYDEAYDYYHGLRTVNWNTDDEAEICEVREYMKQRGFTSDILSMLGAKITYNRQYQLLFPMKDNGKFKGWVSRTMIPEVAEKRKYLYNKGFSRATSLVGDYGSKDYVFVVEGFMDRAKFIQHGESNVVAILGWKMSPLQEKKLKQAGVTKIISALDNDICGRKGTGYLQTIAGFEVTRFKYLKGIKDPGDTTKEQFWKMHKKTMQEFERRNSR